MTITLYNIVRRLKIIIYDHINVHNIRILNSSVFGGHFVHKHSRKLVRSDFLYIHVTKKIISYTY